MDVSGNQPAGAAGPGVQLGPAGIRRSLWRRRPSGQPPPLPHQLQTTGVGWLIAAVVSVVLSLLVFAGGLQGLAVDITVVDDAVVGWLAGLRAPGLPAAMQVLAALGSYLAITVLLWGLLLGLLFLRRLRQLLVVLLAWILQGFLIQYLLAPLVQRPRPFGVEVRTDWYAWALPSAQLAALTLVLVGILYGLVPEGRWRQTGKWVATALVILVAVAHLYLGVEAPSDILVGVALGVAIPLLGFRWFAPSQVFPITYRRGRSAHLDVGGARGQASRQALQDQLGLVVEQVEPFGLAGQPAPRQCGSGSRATPIRGCSPSCMPRTTCAPTAGTSWAGSCCTGGWRTRSRSTPCGGNQRRLCGCPGAGPAVPAAADAQRAGP
jgi:membrane-associated phospholipid phosphatase